jgi:hypothetical protein
MKLYLLYERRHKQDPHFFDYGSLAKEKWREILRQAQKEQEISFDTENDDAIAQRTISLPQQEGAVSKPRFNCEMRMAGGDWQVPVAYFRCQLMDGWAEGLSQYSNPFFCFIPSKDDGNNLIRTDKDKWSAADDQGRRKSEVDRPNEQQCWAALKQYLEQIGRRWRDGINEGFWTLAPEAGQGNYPGSMVTSIPRADDTGEEGPKRHSMLLHPSDRDRFIRWGHPRGRRAGAGGAGS